MRLKFPFTDTYNCVTHAPCHSGPSDADMISEQAIIGSDVGLLPNQHKAIIYTNSHRHLITPTPRAYSTTEHWLKFMDGRP